MSSEDMLRCPYEMSHEIKRSRMITHLVKCSSAHLGNSKLKCPFDASHIVDRQAIESHVATCPSSGNVMNFAYSLEPQRTVGTVSLQEAATIPPTIQDEDWNGDAPSYDPDVVIQQRGIMKLIPTLSKAARRKRLEEERRRLASRSDYDSDQAGSSGSSCSSGSPSRQRTNSNNVLRSRRKESSDSF